MQNYCDSSWSPSALSRSFLFSYDLLYDPPKMKSLRKSLNGNKESSKLTISTPLPIPTLSKPPTAILPPQKVIRALTTYEKQAPQELSFWKGDFFYVLRDAEDSAWYEAHNPVTGARGLVARAMFEEFSKNAIPYVSGIPLQCTRFLFLRGWVSVIAHRSSVQLPLYDQPRLQEACPVGQDPNLLSHQLPTKHQSIMPS